VLGRDGKYYLRSTGEELECGGVIKMSKSKSNVVNAQTVIDTYGTDAARIFVMSDSPADKDFEWTDEGIRGCCRYVSRFYSLLSTIGKKYDFHLGSMGEIVRQTHRTIRDVTYDLENFEFNRAIARIREFTNFLDRVRAKTSGEEQNYFSAVVVAVKLLSPFAPHLCSEMLELLGIRDTLWPDYDERLARDEEITMAVQVNGKLRGTISVKEGTTEEEILVLARSDPAVEKHLDNRQIRRTIVVPGRVINIVTTE
jgi:leucyl-tRNA synthetase